MAQITREQLERLYNKQKRLISLTAVITLLCMGGALVLLRLSDKTAVFDCLPFNINIFTAILIALPFIYVGAVKKRLLPSGTGKQFQAAMAVVGNDFLSDKTLDVLFSKLPLAKNSAERLKIVLIIADVYQLRGEYDKAEGMLDSPDSATLIGYPTVGLEYYNSLIDLYSRLGDNERVLAEYSKAEAFINECANRNYSCCNTALSILINAEKAKGNYRKALDMKLMKNDFLNYLDSLSAKSIANTAQTPLSRVIRGSVFLETAELCYLAGDIKSAAEYIDTGGPMLAACPSETERANRLADRIRAKINQGGDRL